MKTVKNINFEPLEKALKSLKDGLSESIQTDLQRDGIIQRFEYTFELSWKSIRSLLIALGRNEVSSSPRPLFRDALEENLIDHFDRWLGFLEARNQTAHTYSDKNAEAVFKKAQEFPEEVESLLIRLKKTAKDNE
tara:strand:+ start:104 stop:508 length:405 start_codon:yes stop_codon:yes gene_type:complete